MARQGPGETPEQKLKTIFQGVSTSLQADFSQISAQIKHSASKGRVREAAVAQEFLAKYAPRNVSLAHGGEILTTSGETSNECDLILYEPAIPALVESSEYRIFPVEAVYGVAEVKSKLDSAGLKDAHAKIRRVKRFRKDAYDDPTGKFAQTVKLYGRTYHYFPIVGFVFAFDSIELTTLARTLADLQEEDDPADRVDSVWVLNKGMLLNATDSGGIETSPLQESSVAALASEDVLLWLAVMLQDTFQPTFAHRFRLTDYLTPSFPIGTVLNAADLNRARGDRSASESGSSAP